MADPSSRSPQSLGRFPHRTRPGPRGARTSAGPSIAAKTLAILGESGSGKSVSASAVMDLIDMPPGEITSGEILYEGRDLLTDVCRRAPRDQWQADCDDLSGSAVSHLNPVYTVGWQIAESADGPRHAARRGSGQDAGTDRQRSASPMPTRGLDEISASVLWRSAPAADDRHGAGAAPGHPDRRRADNRARRDGAGADPRPVAGLAARDRHGAVDHHP